MCVVLEQMQLESWLVRKLDEFADACEDLILWTETEPQLSVLTKFGRVTACPSLALFASQPAELATRPLPLLVVEFVLDGDIRQEWKGNATFYLRDAGVCEHWVVHQREGPEWLVLSTRRLHKGSLRLNEFCRGR